MSIYIPPSTIKESYARWEHGTEQTPANALMKAAISQALDDGVFYSSDMADRVAEILGVTQAQRDADIVPGKVRCVEGGPFAMECYLARKVVEAERFAIADSVVRDNMKLAEGVKIGKIKHSDGKYIMGVVVTKVTDNIVYISGSRGPQKLTMKCNYTTLKNYIDRAKQC